MTRDKGRPASNRAAFANTDTSTHVTPLDDLATRGKAIFASQKYAAKLAAESQTYPPGEWADDPWADDPTPTIPGPPRIWRATDLHPARQPEWLARGWLPRAALTILVGDEGIGKSLFWVRLVAAITTGSPLAEVQLPAGAPQAVTLVLTEDDWATVVLPRLLAAGADLALITVCCAEMDGSGTPVFPADLHLLRDVDPPPALIVVDAWLDTLPPGISVRDPQGARQALHPLREFAVAENAAIMLITHTNRISSGNARDKYGATAELRKKARLTLFAQKDESGQLIIGPEKANSTAIAPAAMFSIMSVPFFDPTETDDGTVGILSFAGKSDRTAAEHLFETHESQSEGTDSTTAARWLEEYLAMEGPGADSAAAKREAAKAGIRERTLQRARTRLGVVVGEVGYPRRTTWSLPGQAQPANTLLDAEQERQEP